MTRDAPALRHDPLVRQLAQLLSLVDLEAKLASWREGGEGRAGWGGLETPGAAEMLRLARLACGAARASLFQIEHLDAGREVATVVRVARDVGAAFAGGEPGAMVIPLHAASAEPLLTAMHVGGPMSVGPLDDSEPFYALHRAVEPVLARHAGFCSVVVGGSAIGVLEVARTEGDPFGGEALEALEAAAHAVGVAVLGARRERTIVALLAEVLPELFDPARAPTSLPERVLQWVTARGLSVDERRTLSLAATIAQIADASPAGLELAQTVLSAIGKAFATAGSTGGSTGGSMAGSTAGSTAGVTIGGEVPRGR